MSPSHLPASVRRSVLAPLEARGRVEAVERRLAEAIQLGLFGDGEQLPAEAELAARLGVATVTLREALVGLRRTGLVETRRGRTGGTFVRAPAEGRRAALLERLAGLTADELRDLGDERAAVAVAAAGLAAERASEPDLGRLRAHVDALAAADSVAQRRLADGRFHVELAATARSPRLTSAEMQLQTEAGALTWLALGPEQAATVLADHRAILDAVVAGDAARARTLTAEHVARETAATIALRLEAAAPAFAGAATSGRAAPSVGAPAAAAGTPDAPPAAAAPRAVLDAVSGALDDVFAGIVAIRDEVAALDEGRLRRSGLDGLRSRIHARLEDADGLIAGTGAVFAPGVLADAPRWLEWWCAGPDGQVTFLDASLDPDDPDYYDYESAEWFATPRETGERWITGPFVDHSGTDQHIFTLTLPIRSASRFLGVAGADVTVGRIEAIATPLLRAIPGEAALVNHRGRVIASNTPRRLAGTLWQPAQDGAAEVRHERLRWAVLSRRSP